MSQAAVTFAVFVSASRKRSFLRCAVRAGKKWSRRFRVLGFSNAPIAEALLSPTGGTTQLASGATCSRRFRHQHRRSLLADRCRVWIPRGIIPPRNPASGRLRLARVAQFKLSQGDFAQVGHCVLGLGARAQALPEIVDPLPKLVDVGRHHGDDRDQADGGTASGQSGWLGSRTEQALGWWLGPEVRPASATPAVRWEERRHPIGPPSLMRRLG
jgi:hypothetical protein